MNEELKPVFTGGNHLASALYMLGMTNPAVWRAYDYDTILQAFNQPCADVLVAWKAIMDLADKHKTPQRHTDRG